MAGQGVHRAPQVKDVYKSEIAFTLVPSNLGKKGKTCSYSARLAAVRAEGRGRVPEAGQ